MSSNSLDVVPESDQSDNEDLDQSADLYYAPPPDHVTGEVDDLASLTNLNPETLLKELHVRYEANNIYTYVSDILVAVNPFKQLPIYTPEIMHKYNSKHRYEEKPHIYAVADSAYHNLLAMKKSQCCVISGESGAGKTESAKLVMKQIIELCRMKGLSDGTSLENQIIQVNPLLEAFGNAQTVMNDNSSRFGKYTRMIFTEEGSVLGIQLSEYLLEKSRVVEQPQDERNFHIFYYLFAHEDPAKYFLTKPSDFHNLSGQLWADNAQMYADLKTAMEVVGFSQQESEMIHSILAACIHLPNINFNGSESSTLRDAAPLSHVAQLLNVDEAKLLEVLTSIDSVMRGETIRRQYKPDQAYDCRDALAKALYGSLFGWIVNSINRMLAPELHTKDHTKATLEIGILDIFGFENFKSNSFEQLCINLAHEQLQYFFNKHTFTLELEEYRLEGIDATEVSYRDNDKLIQMFLEKPIGILSLLDEECTFPNASDASFTNKLNDNFKDNTFYKVVKMGRDYPAFSIEHFPGLVEYNSTNFLEKNRDNLAPNIVELMQSSGLTIVRDVFLGEVLSTGQIRPRFQQAGDAQQVYSKVNRRTPTLSAQFKNSLAILMDRMTKCYPHFVRCIKPNLNQRAEFFIPEFVKTQLLYTGVLEVTRIRQEGYAWRPAFDEFVRRYKIIAFDVLKLNDVEETEKNAIRIIKRVGLDNWLVGKTKLFLKFYHYDYMEKRLEKFFKDVVRSQNAVRRHWACRELHKLQARARMEKAERERLEAMEAAERRVLEEERRKKREEEARVKAEKEALLAEKKKKDRVLAEEQAQKAAEERAQREAARKEAEAEAFAAAEAARRLAEGHEADQALQLAEKAEQEAQRLRAEREAALAAAEAAQRAAAARRLEMQRLAEAAEEARKAQAAAEEEARQIHRERKQSRKLRAEEFNEAARRAAEKAAKEAAAAEEARRQKEEAERIAKEAEDARLAEERRMADEKQAALMERLRKMEEEARKAKESAEQQGKAAAEALRAKQEAEEIARAKEAERLAEEARLAEERAQDERERMEADVTRPEFNLEKRLLKVVPNGVKSKDVVVEPRRCMGWLTKMKARDLQTWMGSLIRKGTSDWISRYFVLDLDARTFHYYETEKLKKLKSSIPPESIIRVYYPPPAVSAQFKMEHLFMIETKDRTYFCQAPSDHAAEIWLAALSAVATCNHQQGSSASLNIPGSAAASPVTAVPLRPHLDTMRGGSRLSMLGLPPRTSNA